jgi:hypothetical protein
MGKREIEREKKTFLPFSHSAYVLGVAAFWTRMLGRGEKKYFHVRHKNEAETKLK